MLLVVDANVLVAELLHERGRQLVAQPVFRLRMTPKGMGEAAHELEKRIAARRAHSDQSADVVERVAQAVQRLVERRVHVVPPDAYLHWEDEARERIPHDADDWPTVALAIDLRAAIWTSDRHFLGCGIATWTSETLQARLRRYGAAA